MQRHHFADYGPCSQSYGFSSSHVRLWELDHKEGWAPKNRSFYTVMLRRLLRVPWTARRCNQSILKKSTLNTRWKDWCWSWSSNTLATCVKSRLIGKDPDAGKDWGQEEKGTTEDEMIEWHHQLNGHEFEQAPGVNDGQGSLVCCSPWVSKESDKTERLNWLTENSIYLVHNNWILNLLWQTCWKIIMNENYFQCVHLICTLGSFLIRELFSTVGNLY